MSTTNQVSEEVKQDVVEQPAAPEKKTGTVKNQSALLRYITVLFAVAFLVVLLSMVISYRQSQDTITALNATSASAMENAEALQASNRELSDKNAELQIQINDLEQALEDKDEELSRAQEQIAEAQAQAEETAKAYELLLTAISARQNGDTEGFNAAMAELQGLQDMLTGEALTRYEELVRVW